MSDVKERMLWMLESIERNVRSAHPDRVNVIYGQQMVLSLFVVCINNLTGIALLLSRNYVDQARIVARTLSVDAMRIAYIHKHSEQLDLMRVAFERDSLMRERQLLAEYVSLKGEDDDARSAQADLDELESDLNERARRHDLDDHDLRLAEKIFRRADKLFTATQVPQGILWL